MPMNFPDIKSLERRAEMRGFRKLNDGETEQEYRSSFADFMDSVDMIEACGIRNKVGWDQWTDAQKLQALVAKFF